MTIEYLGDTHLGKRFQTGVPLHRRGDREVMQWAQFEANLMNTMASLHLQVGDLFDTTIVPYSVVYRAAMAYRAARKKNPNTTYVVMQGNHDRARDADRISAFQLFAELVRPYGVLVVDEEPIVFVDHNLAAVPWHPFRNAAEMAELLPEGIHTTVHHCDVVLGQENQLPVEVLKSKGVKQAVTGHDHVARNLVLGGLPVRVTGSMTPFSHGEDPEGRLYITKTLAEVLAQPDAWKDNCLRVVLGPNETLDEAIDCLQLTIQRQSDEGEVDLGEVDFDAFDLKALFNQAREEVGLDEEFGALVLGKLEEERAAHT